MCLQLRIEFALEDAQQDLARTKTSVFAEISAGDDYRYVNIKKLSISLDKPCKECPLPFMCDISSQLAT